MIHLNKRFSGQTIFFHLSRDSRLDIIRIEACIKFA